MTASQLVPVVPGTIGNTQCLTIDGRTLHSVLGVRRDFSNWIKGRISKYGFVQGQDFEVFAKTGENSELDSPNLGNQKNHGGGRRSIEYRCTLGMGKELCMVENNEKGRVARRYFIECERRLLSPQTTTSHDGQLSPTERAELKALVDAKLSAAPAAVQGKARAEIWTRFNRHFRIAEYAQLPAGKMPDAREYLIQLSVKALQPSPQHTATALPPAPSSAPAVPSAAGPHMACLLLIEDVRERLRTTCHPGAVTMKMTPQERKAYHACHAAYVAADEALAGAYSILDAGRRIVEAARG